MIVELRALILDEGVVDGREEVVRRGGAVVLLRVQPARGEAGVPRENQLALGRRSRRGRERDDRRRGGDQDQRDGQPGKQLMRFESGRFHSEPPLRGS
jgi:hypothetical protein